MKLELLPDQYFSLLDDIKLRIQELRVQADKHRELSLKEEETEHLSQLGRCTDLVKTYYTFLHELKMASNMVRKAVCVLIENEDGEILAVSRKNNPNDFGLPGGKVEVNESEEQAVVREMLEETGLILINPRKIFEHSSDREYFTTCWTGDISGELKTKEAGIVKWVEPAVLTQGSFGEYNKKLFLAQGIHFSRLDFENYVFLDDTPLIGKESKGVDIRLGAKGNSITLCYHPYRDLSQRVIKDQAEAHKASIVRYLNKIVDMESA